MGQPITLEDVKAHEDVQAYIRRADQNMEAIGYTEHGFRHATVVSDAPQHHRLPRTQPAGGGTGGHRRVHSRHRQRRRPHRAWTDSRCCFPMISYTRWACRRWSWRRSWPPSAITRSKRGIRSGLLPRPSSSPISPTLPAAASRDINPSRYDEHDRVNYATISSSLIVNHNRTLISLSLETDTTIASDYGISNSSSPAWSSPAAPRGGAGV